MTSAILDRWYGALRGGDLNALRAVATSDIRIWWNGPADLVPWAGEHCGIDAAIAFFRQVTDHLAVLSTEATEHIVATDTIVVILRAHWRLKATGRDIEARAVNLFRFRDGLVAGYEVYPDSAAFARALADVGNVVPQAPA